MTREEERLQAAIEAAMKLPKEEKSDGPIFPTAPVNHAPPVETPPLSRESANAIVPLVPVVEVTVPSSRGEEKERDWDAVEKELSASLETRGKKREAKSSSLGVLAVLVVLGGGTCLTGWLAFGQKGKVALASDVGASSGVTREFDPESTVESYRKSLDEEEMHLKKLHGTGSSVAGEGKVSAEMQGVAAQMQTPQKVDATNPDTAPTLRIMPVNR